MKHPLANKGGIAAICFLLGASSPLCCGVASRKTSKRWAKCLKCGRTKIPRMEMDEAAGALEAVERDAGK